jgi:UDP:flavonoid glycosyltransferase YjiC (YdhE family)
VSLNVLLVPLGSHGDVHPFVGIGIRLRERGHRVRVIVNPHFESLVRGANLELVPISTDAEYRRMAGNPAMWRRLSGPPLAIRALAELLRPTYEAIRENNVPGRTVVAASSLAFGARIAQDHLGIPTATVHLQPLDFRSFIDPPKFPGMWTGRGAPRWLMRAQFAFADRFILDRLAGPPVNALRTELGLPPARGILRDWWNSPQRVIGLFPGWFAAPQADWPPQTRLTGFPLYDERGVTTLDPALLRFLDEGQAEPPIAFTFGSAMWHARELLETSAQACALLGRRGILLTRHSEQVPAELPPGVIHVGFAPFSELLPRCAAIVHHGGIGTSSQGLAAGVPHLVMPHAYDQPDNAARLVRLGVAHKLEPRQFHAKRVARELEDLLSSSAVAARCREVAGRFVGVDSIGSTCDWIERLAEPGNALRNEDRRLAAFPT